MQLTELWPYALITVSGGALVLVLFMLLVAPRDAARLPDRRRMREPAGSPAEQPVSALAHPMRERGASPQPGDWRGPPEASLAQPRPDGSTPPPARSLPRPQSPPLQDEGFGAALRSGERPLAARDEGSFDIPSFLRREAQGAEPDAAPAVAPAAPVAGRLLANGLGRIAFDPPRAMRESVAVVLTVRLVRPPEAAGAVAPVVAGLRGASAPPAMSAPVCAAVALSAAQEAFRIEAHAPLVQVLDERRPVAEWKFRVTPLKAGRQRLDLTIAGVRNAGGALDAVDQDALPSIVAVQADGRRRATRIAQVAAALLGVVIIAWVVAAYAGGPR